MCRSCLLHTAYVSACMPGSKALWHAVAPPHCQHQIECCKPCAHARMDALGQARSPASASLADPGRQHRKQAQAEMLLLHAHPDGQGHHVYKRMQPAASCQTLERQLKRTPAARRRLPDPRQNQACPPAGARCCAPSPALTCCSHRRRPGTWSCRTRCRSRGRCAA